MSLAAMGSASEENDRYMESLEAKTQALKSAFENLVLGEGGLNAFAKNILDITTSFIKFIGYGDNLVAVLGTLVGVIMLFNQQIAINAATSFVTVIKDLGVLFRGLTGNISGAITGLSAYKAAMDAGRASTASFEATAALAGNALALLSIAVGVVVMAYNKYKQAQEEAVQAARDAISDYSAESKSIEDLQKGLDDIYKSSMSNAEKQEQIKTIIESNTDIFGDYDSAIRGVGDAYDYATTKLKEYSQEEADRAYYAGLGEAETAAQRVQTYGLTGYEVANKLQTPDLSAAGVYEDETSDEISKLIADITDASGYQEVLDSLQAYIDRLSELRDGLDEGSVSWGKLNEYISNASSIYSEVEQSQQQDITTLKEFANIQDNVSDKEKLHSDIVEDANKIINKNTKAIKDNANAKEDTIDILDEEFDSTEAFNDLLKETNSQLDLVSNALKEYDKNGAVNADTLNSLLQLQPELLSNLINEKGQLDVNANSLKNLSEAMKVNAIQALQESAANDILAMSVKNGESMSNLAKSAIAGLGNSMQTAGNQASTASGQLASFAMGVWEVLNVDPNNPNMPVDFEKKANAIINAYKSVASSIGRVTISTRSSTGATNRSTKANKKAEEQNKKLAKSIDKVSDKLKVQKERIEDTLDALEDRADQMEDVFKIVADRIDEQIDQIQKERDEFEKQNEAIEEQITLQEKLDALQQAKERKVFTYNTETGQWEWSTDVQAVSEAQADLDEYNRQQAYQARLDEYDAEIDRLNGIKEQVEEIGGAYDRSLDDKLLKEYGINMDTILQGNIDSLNKLAKSYAETQNSIAQTTKELEKLEDAIKAIEKLADTISDASSRQSLQATKNAVEQILKDAGLSGTYKVVIDSSTNKISIQRRASGDAYISDDGVYLVGDSPNEELVLGREVNNGTGRVMGLTKGSGVVNAKSTKTLAGVLNQLGSFASSNFGAGGGIINNSSSTNKSTVFQISNVNVNANNPTDFVEQLQNFAITMKQEAY